MLVTGHTGVKGGWLCLWLNAMGAEVTGLSLGAPTTPSLFELARVQEDLTHLDGDVRDLGVVRDAVARHQPEVVFHLAAQALVRRSYADAVETFETNVMGTVNLLEAVRDARGVRVVVNVTSDKCYEDRGGNRGHREDDPKGGADPYSASKACAELVTAAYRSSFFTGEGTPALASARAGNVIAGGDWGLDRLVPDAVRAAAESAPLRVRNPEAVRPWQHVLNPLSGYLRLAEVLWHDPTQAYGWNFGPDEADARPVAWVVERLVELWDGPLEWQPDPGPHPRETQWLRLDSTRARERLGWRPGWNLEEGLARTVDWYRAAASGNDMRETSLAQIADFADSLERRPAGSTGSLHR